MDICRETADFEPPKTGTRLEFESRLEGAASLVAVGMLEGCNCMALVALFVLECFRWVLVVVKSRLEDCIPRSLLVASSGLDCCYCSLVLGQVLMCKRWLVQGRRWYPLRVLRWKLTLAVDVMGQCKVQITW